MTRNQLKLIGCTDCRTYASFCDMCSHKANDNNCEHAYMVKLYEENVPMPEGYKLVGCRGNEFYLCSLCPYVSNGDQCISCTDKKVYSNIE
jgi:hypothetical protein